MKIIKSKCVLKSKKLGFLVASIVLMTALSLTEVHAADIVNRYSGIDRYETAAKVCQDGWKQNSDYAVLVNGEDFPDALSAAPLAKKYNAPILLTGKDVLNMYTSVEIKRLNPKNIFIIGGKGVVSQSIEDAVKAQGIKVTRLSGADRFETALQVASKLGKANEIAVVNANDFHDGMSIAAIAALKGMPIILTDKNYMTNSVKKYIQSNKKVDQIYVIGGTDQISDSIMSLIPNAKRIGYGDAYERNASIIDAFQNEISTGTLYIASAKDFPDSLGASALAHRTSSPILFVDMPINNTTNNFLKSKIVNNIKILGGDGAVNYETEQIVKNLPLEVENTDNITDTIWQNEKYTPRQSMVITASDGNRKEVPVDWSLTKVNTTKPGIYTFNGKILGTDKTVMTTLIVKPLPYKIDDLNISVRGRTPNDLPETIKAVMTDGTTSNLPVNWDYGSQQVNKLGVYVFNGTVEHYTKKVKLTLTVNVLPENKKVTKIENIKVIVNKKSEFSLPGTVIATMDDNTKQSIPVASWGPEKVYPDHEGVYIYEGLVNGYNEKFSLMLIVKEENGVDPDDPDYPDNKDDVITDMESIETMQGEPYTLPPTAVDPATGKSLPITWRTISMDTNTVDRDNYSECRVSTISLEGTLKGSTNKVRINVVIRPKIVGVYSEDLHVTIKNSDYIGQIYKMPTTVRVIIGFNADGIPICKNAAVISWDPPYVDLGNPQRYYARGILKHYKEPVIITIDVTDQ